MTHRIWKLFGCCWLVLAAQASATPIVINEIHCSRPKVAIHNEFIELYNASSQSVDLSQWQLTGGIQFTFPDGFSLAAGQYLLVGENAQVLLDSFGTRVRVAGAYTGKLGGDGELLQLLDAQRRLIDEVDYNRGFPWPLVGGETGHSLQLMHPELDNALPAYWRSAKPTPGLRNEAVFLADKNPPPAILKVKHQPEQPKSNTPVLLTAKIYDEAGVTEAQALVQIVEPGKYIRLEDANYEKIAYWRVLEMNDAGRDGDKQANDGVFSVTVPDSFQRHRRLIRYRIWAKDASGKSIRVPYPDDTQPNFAYFVYDGLPPYAGHDLSALHPLPVCHLIALQSDVDYLINRYGGTNYKQTGTIVYNGEVYDHISFRSRGFNNRHSRTKRNMKFNFNRGHDVEVLRDDGEPYPVKRGKMALSGTWLLDKPNTHGLAESVLYRLFTMQGTPASYADYMHLRVIDEASESDTLRGDFWGIYLILENQDGDFLRTHDLPDGNVYSYKPFKLRHEGEDGPYGARNRAYVEWDTSHDQRRTLDWWKAHIDVPAFCGFIIGNQAINNRETGYRGQHWWTEYMNPKTGHWYVFPWDLDVTWKQTTGSGTIAGAIRKPAFSHPEIQIQYENQLRSFLDLLYNEEQAFRLIDEEASYIYNPNLPYSWTHLDRLRWRHNYSNYADEIHALKQFVVKRRAHILSDILPAATLPTPEVRYIGQESYPADALRFQLAGASANAKAMQWRIAEVTDPSNPYYQQKKTYRFEIEAEWTSEALTDLNQPIVLPAGVIKVGRSYRVRVRVRDAQGRYSHWSAPHSFIPNPPIQVYGAGVVIHEVMYHPSESCGVEFVELYNNSPETVNLSGFEIKGGVDYTFPEGSKIEAGGYVVLTNEPRRFEDLYGYEPTGKYKGSMDNKGERLRLMDPFGGIVDSLRFDNKTPWDEKAAGLGFSLELVDIGSDNAHPDNWKASNCQCGTPGNPNRAETPPTALYKGAPPANYRPLFFVAVGLVVLGLIAAAWWSKSRVKTLYL